MVQGRELSDGRFQTNSLDGLRGLAVLMVFFSHASHKEVFILPFADLAGIGKPGVFLFFALSAFLLSLPFIKKGAEALDKNFLLNFLIRRFFRIYPLYFFYLLTGLVTSLVLWETFDLERLEGFLSLSFKDFFEHLLLMQAKGVTWSILVEFRYYFLLPILALIYSVVFKNRLLPSIGLTVGLIILSQFFWPQSEATSDGPKLGPYLPILFMGSLLAVVFNKWQNSPLRNDKKVVLAIELLGLLAVIAVALMTPAVSSFFLGEEIAFDHFHNKIILFGLLWSVVLFSCMAGSGMLRSFFENRVLRYLGFISFSVYLLHMMVISLVYELGADIPVKAWIMLIITIAVSHISWALVEKPTSKIRWVQKRRDGPLHSDGNVAVLYCRRLASSLYRN